MAEELTNNLIAFWLLGLCNNFAYVIMLSAAKDILEVEEHQHGGDDPMNGTNHTTDHCLENISEMKCSPISTGSVLLADILPTLAIKLIAPFTLQRVPYNIRHTAVVVFQSLSYIIVALSSSVAVGITGVVFASIGAGLGEITYLSLASHFHNDVITSWSSGTGGAGIFGSLIYAMLTDKKLFALTPRTTLLLMLIIPTIFTYTFWKLLQSPSTVKKFTLFVDSRGEYVAPPNINHSSSDDEVEVILAESTEQPLLTRPLSQISNHIQYENLSFGTLFRMTKPLYKYMIPLSFVYFGEYFINQGLVELITFDCKHGFGFSPRSQYRWYQVIYQFGVFISRSSAKILPLHSSLLPVLSVLQLINAGLFFKDAISPFVPHIFIIFIIIFYEGLLGGAAYVNTFRTVHKSISETTREFSLSFVALADSFGIVTAGFLAIPAHNFICQHRNL
jgi:battenin